MHQCAKIAAGIIHKGLECIVAAPYAPVDLKLFGNVNKNYQIYTNPEQYFDLKTHLNIIDWQFKQRNVYIAGNYASAKDIQLAFLERGITLIIAGALEVGESGLGCPAVDRYEHHKYHRDQQRHSYRLHNSFSNETEAIRSSDLAKIIIYYPLTVH